MSFDKVERARWHDLFDRVSKELRTKQVQTEIAGLDLGDQIEEDWLTLDGITYDAEDDTLWVYAHGSSSQKHLEHAIVAPQEVYVEHDEDGLSRVVAMDGEKHEQFLKLRAPLKLPA